MKKGTFTSVWDGGYEVTTNAELNEETGEVTAESIDVDDLDLEYLEREYFTDEEENEFRICPTCHAYIMTNKMFDGIGHTYCKFDCRIESNQSTVLQRRLCFLQYQSERTWR